MEKVVVMVVVVKAAKMVVTILKVVTAMVAVTLIVMVVMAFAMMVPATNIQIALLFFLRYCLTNEKLLRIVLEEDNKIVWLSNSAIGSLG